MLLPALKWMVTGSSAVSIFFRRSFGLTHLHPFSASSFTRNTWSSAAFSTTRIEEVTSQSQPMSNSQDNPNPKTILVPVSNGSEEIEAITIIDTLVRAGAKVTVGSVGGTKTSDGDMVTLSRGVKLIADVRLSDLPESEDNEWDCVAIPGGLPGADYLAASPELQRILKSRHEAGKTIGAICASPAIVLAPLGILKGVEATAYPAGPFTAAIPDHKDAQVVESKHIITSQGPATAMSFSLKLVDTLYGAETAKSVGDSMLYSRKCT